MRSEGRRAHSEVVGFTRCRRVHSGSLGSRVCALLVVDFIRGRWVRGLASWGSWGSLGVVGFMWVRPGGRGDHSVSLGSRGCYLVSAGVVWFT